MTNRGDDVVFGAMLNSPARHSVLAELRLLKECCSTPDSVEEPLRTLLLEKIKSQAGLASMEWEKRGIVSMSLNTHKSAAGEVIVGGFKTLDSYRKAAIRRLQEQLSVWARPPRGTIAWYKAEFESKSAENKALIDEILLLTGRMDSLMGYARKLAINANRSEEFLALQSELLRRFPHRNSNDKF